MEKIEIGTVLRPQGLRGEIKVQPHTDDASRFCALSEVYLGGDSTVPVRVLNARVGSGEVYLMLSGVADRDGAERLRGKSLYVARENAVPLAEDTYFIVDVLGCRVVTERGDEIGTVKDVLQHGAADVYVLEDGTMFPFLKDVAREVDIAAKRIVVDEKRFSEVAVYAD